MFNAGVRGKRAKDGVGFLSAAEQFNQKSFLVPTVTSFSVTDVSYVPLDNTAVDTAGGETIVINGSGFASGATVQVGATTIGSVTFIDQNRLAFSAPALSSGSYTIYVTNSNGGTGILVSGLVYSGLPTYSTSAGSLGTVYETANINTAVVATGDAPITYSVISGTLPSGATLNSNGTITGNAPVDGSSTTYSFTIQASDGQLQDSTRSFSLTINTDVLTWGLANNTVYTLEGNSVMSNVTLSATSTANSNSAVTFSANTLPTGVSLSGNTIFGTPTVEQTVYSALTATATQTGRTATRFVSWSVSLGDPYWKNVSLLLTGNSPVDTFVTDASTNNFAVSIVGDTKPNNFNPNTPGYYSNYFDGTGDSLSIPNSSSFNLTSDFTFECWIYNSAVVSGEAPIYGKRAGNLTYSNVVFGLDVSGGANKLFLIGTTSSGSWNIPFTRGSTTLPLGQWNHIAVVRSSTTLKTYVNGVAESTWTGVTGSFFTNTDAATIGVSTTDGTAGYYTGHISNFRFVNGTAVYTANFTPPTTPLTAITNTSLLTCQSNRFIDTSTNAFAITRNGDVAVRQINPFIPDPTASTYGSAFFDGTGDYLNTPSNASFTFGTGDLTLECWIYQTATSVSTYRVIFGDDVYGSSGGYTLYSYNNALNLWKGGSGGVEVIAPAGTITLNVWNHVAWTRSGSSNRLFINGTQVGATTTDATNYTSTRSYIGASQAGSLPFTGYISNLRIVKGTAVYTAAFTPPTAPLTAITNTSLLTLQTNQAINNNLFIDDSTNNFAVTRAGNTTQGTFSPYGANWSNYFDGTGDYLSVPSSAALNLTGDFTLETWIYPTTINSYNMILGSSGTVNPDYFTIRASSIELGITTNSNYPVWNYSFVTNTWYYIVISRASGALKAFVNGQQLTLSSGSANDSSQIFPSGFTNFIGRYAVPEVPHYFTGYISNLRVVKGTAVYTSTFTPSTAPLTAISGTSLLTCQSNRLRDASTNNFTITKAGDVRVQRFSPFSPSAAYSLSTIGGSAYFDGTGDYLSVNTANAFGSGTGSFTAEFWVYPFSSSVVNLVDFRGSAGTGSTQLRIAFGAAAINPNKIIAGWVSDNQLISTSNVVLNAWTHVAVVRNGTSASLYINGVAESTITNSTAITDSGTYIGAYRGTEAFLNGYLSNLRVVSGTAVYTANFTPPTAPVTAITNTSLLLNFTDAGVVDNAMINNLETVGDARVSREVSKFGSGAMYFDGTGDYLKTPSSPNLGFGTGDFTVECWINTSTKNIVILDPRTSNSEPGVFFIQSTTGFIGYYDNTVGSLSGTTNVTTGAWFHLAWSRSGTTFRMFVNGTQEYSGTNSGNFGTSRPAVIGASWEISAFVNGYIDDLRITKGVARYTANFTAPTSALQIK